MKNAELRGVVVPVVTPVNDKDNVAEAAFRKLLRRLVDAGVHGFLVGGSSGESPLLVGKQWRRMAEIALDEVHGEVPVLCGVMDASTRKVCKKIKFLRGIGCRYFALTPTFYIAATTASEHLRLFGQAKEAAGDMEMVAYNIPQCTLSHISVDTFCELTTRGWIRCCKDSSGDWPHLQELIRRGRDVGLAVLDGDEGLGGEALLAGAQGIIPLCGNYDPAVFVRLYEAGSRGDREEVARLMTRVSLLREKLVRSGPCWLAGTKYAVAALGIGSGRPVSPLEPADAQQRAGIDALIEADRAAGNIVPQHLTP
jgi:4-hydroxy-tetrahydrodipicolinate synthase